MASEITDQDQAASPSNQEELLGNGNAAGEQGGPENRGIKRQRTSTAGADDDDDDDDKPGRERRKIEIKFIQDKSRRHITFSKRKAGIMKKVGQHHQLLRDLTRSSSIDITFVACTNCDRCRRTNCLSSPARKSSFLSSPRPVWSTRSPHRSFNHWSPSQKERTSSRFVANHGAARSTRLTYHQGLSQCPRTSRLQWRRRR